MADAEREQANWSREFRSMALEMQRATARIRHNMRVMLEALEGMNNE